jgi:hypothetical protein
MTDRLTIREVQRALCVTYDRAYHLVLSGALGEVEDREGCHPRYTVSEDAVKAYVARVLEAARKPE